MGKGQEGRKGPMIWGKRNLKRESGEEETLQVISKWKWKY